MITSKAESMARFEIKRALAVSTNTYLCSECQGFVLGNEYKIPFPPGFFYRWAKYMLSTDKCNCK